MDTALHGSRNSWSHFFRRVSPSGVSTLPTILACLVLALFPTPAPAAETPPGLGEMSLEQLMELKVSTVYGASLYAQSTSEAPSSVTIVLTVFSSFCRMLRISMRLGFDRVLQISANLEEQGKGLKHCAEKDPKWFFENFVKPMIPKNIALDRPEQIVIRVHNISKRVPELNHN